MTDLCALCKVAIYPDDESISGDINQYHIDCAEHADIALDGVE